MLQRRPGFGRQWRDRTQQNSFFASRVGCGGVWDAGFCRCWRSWTERLGFWWLLRWCTASPLQWSNWRLIDWRALNCCSFDGWWSGRS
ncbi:hypothetical protein BC831DRAFT_443388 [Entophlyctis helioformis]|nr:hypothetical protein BC831DRAFT_443388 [Entophlyctis helioformis]